MNGFSTTQTIWELALKKKKKKKRESLIKDKYVNGSSIYL